MEPSNLGDLAGARDTWPAGQELAEESEDEVPRLLGIAPPVIDTHEVLDAHSHASLLAGLADHALPRALTRFHHAAGQTPAPAPIVLSDQQNPPCSVEDNGGGEKLQAGRGANVVDDLRHRVTA